MAAILAVTGGAAAGALSRYGIGLWLATLTTPLLPTLLVNIVGSFAAGLLLPLQDNTLRLLLLTGFLGSFTTFSAISLQTLTLLQQNRPLMALAYSGGTMLAGLLAAAGGYGLAKAL